MDLRSRLDGMGIRYAWSHHDRAYTAQQLAMKEHVSGKRVIKPVLIRADGAFVLCALPANYYIDMERLRGELGAREAHIAEERELAALCSGDCEIGAEPPLGWMFGVPTIMDDSLQRQDEVMFQAGSHEDAVRMSMMDYMRLAQPRVGHFAKPRA